MTQTQPFTVSESAAKRIAEIIAARGPDSAASALRVAVSSGGCNGFQYEFRIDPDTAPDDIVISTRGIRVVIDPASLEFLTGAELDFVDKLIGAHFAIKNPNAASSCGCGTSFSPA